jgi:hypothetical protein
MHVHDLLYRTCAAVPFPSTSLWLCSSCMRLLLSVLSDPGLFMMFCLCMGSDVGISKAERCCIELDIFFNRCDRPLLAVGAGTAPEPCTTPDSGSAILAQPSSAANRCGNNYLTKFSHHNATNEFKLLKPVV